MAKTKSLLEATACECGCGQPAQRTFLPGHDAKLKSQLLARYRAGGADAARAEKEAHARGWTHFMTLAPVKVSKPKTNGQSTPKIKTGFHPVRVKIGRWVYDATILSEDVNALTVRYEPKGKQPVVREVPRSAIVKD